MKLRILFLSIILSCVGWAKNDCSWDFYKKSTGDKSRESYKNWAAACECSELADYSLNNIGLTPEQEKEQLHNFMSTCIQGSKIANQHTQSESEEYSTTGVEDEAGYNVNSERENDQTSPVSLFNLQTHLLGSNTCTDSVKIGNTTCYCVSGKTLDFDFCKSYADAIKTSMISQQANTMTTQARAEVDGTKALTEINEQAAGGEDVVVPGLDASKHQVGIQMQGESVNASISASLSAHLRTIASKWITPYNVDSLVSCKSLGEADAEACSKEVVSSKGAEVNSYFPNYQTLGQLQASLKSTDGNLMSSLQGAAESFKNMKQIEKQKEAYLSTLATEDTTSYACTVNPALCEEDDSTNKQAPGTGHSGIGFGGGYTSGSLGSVDDTNGSSDYSSNTTYNAPSDDTSFENEEVAALAPSFDNSPQGSPSGASGASANSSGGGSTPTAREQKMAQQKKLKSMNIDGKSFYRKKKKKRSRFGSTGSNVPKFEDPLKGKNPFAGLFGNKGAKKSKKEVNRALANDGVKRSSNSLFKRITKVHLRKVKNHELLVYRIP